MILSAATITNIHVEVRLLFGEIRYMHLFFYGIEPTLLFKSYSCGMGIITLKCTLWVHSVHTIKRQRHLFYTVKYELDFNDFNLLQSFFQRAIRRLHLHLYRRAMTCLYHLYPSPP